ncbi:MAG: hypothetical protein VXZ82_22860 [Planctomycetota bacterium]|nr:hypothetical protein [Planctomycetota bacterium]
MLEQFFGPTLVADLAAMNVFPGHDFLVLDQESVDEFDIFLGFEPGIRVAFGVSDKVES